MSKRPDYRTAYFELQSLIQKVVGGRLTTDDELDSIAQMTMGLARLYGYRIEGSHEPGSRA